MIVLTKLNGTEFVLNDDLIESMEETPDTTIRLTNSHFVIVREKIDEIMPMIVAYRRKIYHSLPTTIRDEEG